MSIELRAFPKIPRLKRGCVITEKIDGTNAIVHVSDEGIVTAGSRNRWVTPESDHHGFARWVSEHVEELKALGPGYHYGEWWGSGIQRGYGLKEKRFSLFNTSRWGEHSDRPPCCGVVPVLYVGEFRTDTVETYLSLLARNGSLAAPGFMDPEGVVVCLPASQSFYKLTLGGDGHKEAAAV